MDLQIKAWLSPEALHPIQFWAGNDPLNPTGDSVLALRRDFFTEFYQFNAEAVRFDSAGCVQKALRSGELLSVSLILEVFSEREKRDLDGFSGDIESLPEQYRADLSKEPSFRSFIMPLSHLKSQEPQQKSLREAVFAKKTELAEIREQILNAQADEDEVLLAELRPRRNRLKAELEVLETEAGYAG